MTYQTLINQSPAAVAASKILFLEKQVEILRQEAKDEYLRGYREGYDAAQEED